MIKVTCYSVDTEDCDVSVSEYTFDSYESFFEYVINEHGEEDVYGDPIRDQDGDDNVIIQDDVSFVKYIVH